VKLRSDRGADRLRALGLEARSPEQLMQGIEERVAQDRELPAVTIEVSSRPCRARSMARGRYVAGVITIFPRAFADPWTLAVTLAHELGHALGLDETEADALAASVLADPA
jgi:hypothetical protein